MWPRWRLMCAASSPVTRCRAPSGSWIPSAGQYPARPTTAGRVSTSPNTPPPLRLQQKGPRNAMTVRTPVCDLLGIEHPIVGFTPSDHVAAAVSRAGGLGVLGCVRFNDPAELDTVLDWMDANTGGKPYGVDVVMPATVPAEGAPADLGSLIPPGHREFVEDTLLKLGVPPLPDDSPAGDGVLGWLHSVARQHVEVALAHPARL